MKNEALKLSEFSELNEKNVTNNAKASQRQNSSRTTLNTIDQPLYKDSLNASKLGINLRFKYGDCNQQHKSFQEEKYAPNGTQSREFVKK
jgi:hypothetical protein